MSHDIFYKIRLQFGFAQVAKNSWKQYLDRKTGMLKLRFLESRLQQILFWIAFAILTVNALWCSGVFLKAFDLPAFAAWGSVFLLLSSLVASIFFRPALLAAFLLEILAAAAYFSITPERRFSGTVWQTPWRHTLEVSKLDNGCYELRNVRDFLYRSENDFDVRYRTVIVDPKQISSIDAAFSHWDNIEGIAHSMLGLNFEDGTTIVISLETRLPAGADQNGIDGFYRRYELAMLAGTPRDFYGLRTDHRGETLYIYRLDMNRRTMHETVLSVFERAAELRREPQFYNSLCRNCTTGLLPMLPGANQNSRGDIRVMLNGMAAQMLFERNLTVHREGESFGSLRARSLVPGLCRGKDAPPARYGGESEARWLREHRSGCHD